MSSHSSSESSRLQTPEDLLWDNSSNNEEFFENHKDANEFLENPNYNFGDEIDNNNSNRYADQAELWKKFNTLSTPTILAEIGPYTTANTTNNTTTTTTTTNNTAIVIPHDTPENVVPVQRVESMCYVKKSPVHGYGLFASKNILKETIIIQYVGEIKSVDELNAQYPNREDVAPYWVRIGDSSEYIDATDPLKSSIARYANMCRIKDRKLRLCNNQNAKFVTLTAENGEMRVFIKSILAIKENSEIFVSYGKEYFDREYKNKTRNGSKSLDGPRKKHIVDHPIKEIILDRTEEIKSPPFSSSEKADILPVVDNIKLEDLELEYGERLNLLDDKFYASGLLKEQGTLKKKGGKIRFIMLILLHTQNEWLNATVAQTTYATAIDSTKKNKPRANPALYQARADKAKFTPFDKFRKNHPGIIETCKKKAYKTEWLYFRICPHLLIPPNSGVSSSLSSSSCQSTPNRPTTDSSLSSVMHQRSRANSISVNSDASISSAGEF